MDPTLPVAPESRRAPNLQKLAPPRPVDVVLALGALEVEGLRLETCPQCGVNPATAGNKPRTFQWVTPWVYAGLLANILILLILYYAMRVRVTTSLPLCPDCAAADSRARTLTGLSFAGIFAGPLVGALLGSVVDQGPIGAGIGLVAGIVGIIATARAMSPAAIVCRRIDKTAKSITLRAAPSWRPTLEREKPAALFGVRG